jgi:hypothetical protein
VHCLSRINVCSSCLFSGEASVLTLWLRLSRLPWGLVACVVLKLLLTGYSADIQGASAQHATKFSFTQCLVNDKSAPRELPLRVRLLRSSKESFYQVMLIVWWHEKIRNLGPRKCWKHYKNKLPILLVAQSKGVGLQPLACWNCGFVSRRGMGVSLVWVLCVVR